METLSELIKRYPALTDCAAEIEKSADIIIDGYENGGCLFTCGNGGSSADADHIVGELMKSFRLFRPLDTEEKNRITEYFPKDKKDCADRLQGGLPAVSLHSQTAFVTAYINDIGADMVYAQALFVLGKKTDVLIAISTSGNSENVINAARIAAAKGIKIIGLTGEKPCRLDELSDVAIHVGASETYAVQELHLPVYHWICEKIETHFWQDKK